VWLLGATPEERCAPKHVGGGFGAKLGLGPETVAAISLARAAAAPVRVALGRLEELSVTGYRPAAEIELSLLAGCGADLRALRVVAYAEAGSPSAPRSRAWPGRSIRPRPRNCLTTTWSRTSVPVRRFVDRAGR
jgi:CO/xanthine dehydrogenase Mo-binding subunit